MYSNTAYEAMYQYLGLELQQKFIEVVTSQKVFAGLIVLIFGVMFFMTTIQFFSRYMPGALVTRRHVPLSKYVHVIGCLFLGIALLQAQSTTSVKRFDGQSWHQNPYIHGQMRAVAPQYRVSLVFDLMSRTAEEISAFLARVIDSLFQSSHSQLSAPNFFFKAIMYGGAATIDDPDLKRSINFYTDECFDRMLPLIGSAMEQNKLDQFYGNDPAIDQKLSMLTIETHDRTPYSCLEVKNEVREGLMRYTLRKQGRMESEIDRVVSGTTNYFRAAQYQNLAASSMLVNTYLDEHESWMGIQKGSQLPSQGGTMGRVFQYLGRLMSWDGVLSLVGGSELQGAAMAAKRSQEFSEQLARAPHIAGFIKMFLIAIFPFIIFPVVAGRWKVLVYWFFTFFSVCLWAPIWTLLYHIVVSIAVSSEVMAAFGKLTDGISLYSAQLVTSRMYHMYEVYSQIQILAGTLFTGLMVFSLRSSLTDTQSESSPEFISDASNVVSTGAKVAGQVGVL